MATKREMYGKSAAFLITAAESEFDAMLYDAAKKDLEAAVLLDDASYQAHFLLGNTLLAQGARDQAAEEYRKAIALSPKQPRTYYQLALISRARQDEAEEEQFLTQALTVDDHYAPAFCEEGRILFEKHQLQDAVKQLKLAIEYNPQNEEAYYLLARAYAGMGEKEKSQTMVQQYKKIRAANQHSTTDTHAGQIGASETSQP
jgi:protein O-GlcNAc transferase